MAGQDDKFELKMGELVWAKMKGFSPWPGKITEPTPKLKKPKSNKPVHCVYFFGSNNFAWIEDYCIKPYLEHREALLTACKTAAFKEAVAAIDDYISRKEAGENVDAMFDRDDDEDPLLDDLSVNKSMALDENDEETENVATPATPVVGKKPRRARPSSRESRENSIDEKPAPSASARGRPSKKKSIENGDSQGVKTPKRARKVSTSGELDAPGSPVSKPNATAQRKSAATNLLDRPSISKQPDTAPLDVKNVSETLKKKKILASEMKFGFLGLGNMGSGMVKNLINSGHQVIVWNRTPDKCKDFVDAGADQGMTPSDVISTADITFSCVSDPISSKEMVFGNCGVLTEIDASKAYVEMTGIDAESSQDIADAIAGKGGRYLEAQLQGSKSESEEGTLIILAAGDRSLYDDCASAFQAMSNQSFFLGEVGSASKMNLVLQLIQGVSLTALSEGMALADRANLQPRDVLEILSLTSFSSKMIKDKGETIIEGSFAVQQPLQYMQKDLNLALALGNQMEQPLPVTASANEVFKHAKRLGYGEHDASAALVAKVRDWRKSKKWRGGVKWRADVDVDNSVVVPSISNTVAISNIVQVIDTPQPTPILKNARTSLGRAVKKNKKVTFSQLFKK